MKSVTKIGNQAFAGCISLATGNLSRRYNQILGAGGDLKKLLDILKQQLAEGFSPREIQVALEHTPWTKYFAKTTVLLAGCSLFMGIEALASDPGFRNHFRMEPMLAEAIRKDSYSLFSMQMTLTGRRLGRGIAYSLWTHNATSIIRNLLETNPKTLCAVIAIKDLLAFLKGARTDAQNR